MNNSSQSSTLSISSILPSSSQNASVYMSQSSLHDSIHTDPNSPEVLKQNVQIVLDHVARIQSLALSLLPSYLYHVQLSVRQSAYQAGNSPAHTTGNAYPMPPAPESQSASSVPPIEQQPINTTAREVQVLYERLKRIQESNTVAVNLLGAADAVSRTR
ncbi:hypothetical protein BDR06DRAFT_965638 [Suillus hirtellus]|nr:hypothetical protein BDR06DRAFT_965638 [Suillus hirtellus]